MGFFVPVLHSVYFYAIRLNVISLKLTHHFTSTTSHSIVPTLLRGLTQHTLSLRSISHLMKKLICVIGKGQKSRKIQLHNFTKMVFTVLNHFPLSKLRVSSSFLVVINPHPAVGLPVTQPSIHIQTTVLFNRHLSPDRVTATLPTCLYSILFMFSEQFETNDLCNIFL